MRFWNNSSKCLQLANFWELSESQWIFCKCYQYDGPQKRKLFKLVGLGKACLFTRSWSVCHMATEAQHRKAIVELKEFNLQYAVLE